MATEQRTSFAEGHASGCTVDRVNTDHSGHPPGAGTFEECTITGGGVAMLVPRKRLRTKVKATRPPRKKVRFSDRASTYRVYGEGLHN
jgi:hypothetical protein